MKYLIVITLGIILSSPIFSQEQWTLQECVNYALENNIQIKQQALNAQINENNYLQSKAALLPSLAGNASQSNSFGWSVDPFTNDFTENNVMSQNFSVSASMTLFGGFQKLNTVFKNRLDLLVGIENLKKIQNDVSLNIASAFLNILFTEELYNISSQQLDITKSQVERTKKLVEAGSLAKGSLLEMQAQKASEELQLVNAENNYDMAVLTLQQFLDLDSVEDFQIKRPIFTEPNVNEELPTPGMVYYEAVEKFPEIKAAELRVQSSQKSLAIAKGGVLPRLSMNASYGTGYSDARQKVIRYDTLIIPGQDPQYFPNEYGEYPFNEQFKDNASTSIGFYLNIPIFSNLQNYTNIKNAQIGVLNAEYQYEADKNQLYKEIKQAHADAVAAGKKYTSSKSAVEAMQETFNYMQEKFNVGLINTVDYNTSKNNLLKAKSDLLQAKYEYIFKVNILEFYRGNTISIE